MISGGVARRITIRGNREAVEGKGPVTQTRYENGKNGRGGGGGGGFDEARGETNSGMPKGRNCSTGGKGKEVLAQNGKEGIKSARGASEHRRRG